MLIWINSCAGRNRKVLFLDRDGVINRDRPDYIKGWAEFEFYPDSLIALRQAKQWGVDVVLISNQSAVNRGLISWRDFWGVHNRMVRHIADAGGDLFAALYCPHHPDEACPCRKPSPAMIVTAAKLFGIQPEHTFLIGDRKTDLQAAHSAGCRGVLLARGDLHATGADIPSHLIAARYATLMEAVADLCR